MSETLVKSKSTYKEEILESEISYIDPLDCGSIIGYRLYLKGTEDKKSVSGDIDISDCNRMINWSFYGEGSLEKIDNVIEIFTSFKNKLSREMNKKRTK